MEKQEIIKRVNQAVATKATKEMVLLYIDAAYDAGMEDGIKKSTGRSCVVSHGIVEAIEKVKL